MPLSFLYFLVTTHLTTAVIGFGITTAAVAALPVGIIAGPLIDRVGAKPIMIVNNVLSSCGYITYFFVKDLRLLIFATFLIMTADRLFFASWPVLVADMAPPSGTDWLYSLISKYRSASLAAGYLIGGAVLAFAGHSEAAYTIVLLNCISSLLTAIIMIRLKPVRRLAPMASPESAEFHLFSVLHDRAYTILIFAQSALGFAWLLPGTILPIYIVHYLGLPSWMLSAVLCINFVAVTTLQMRVTSRVAKYRRTAVVGVASGFVAAAVGCFALAAHAPAGVSVASVLIGVVCFSFGEMLWNPAANALAADAAPSSAKGRYMAVFQMSWALSSTFGPMLVGVLLAAGTGWLWISLVSVTALGGTGFLLTGRLLPPTVDRVPQNALLEMITIDRRERRLSYPATVNRHAGGEPGIGVSTTPTLPALRCE